MNTLIIQIQNLLSLEKDKITAVQTVLLCLIAYAFGAVCRLFYFFNAADSSFVLLDGVPMISTEDGYFFAYFIKQLIEGHPDGSYYFFLKVGGHGLLILLTWLGAVLSPFSIEQVAVFMPVIFPPLTALPIIYLCRCLGSTILGFFAGLLSVVGMSFFRRTSFAYYDTDFFSLTFPCLIVFLGVYAILNPGIRSTLALGIITAASNWLDKSQITETLQVVILVFYVARNFRHADLPQALILLVVPLDSNLAWQTKVWLVCGLGALMLVLKRYLAIDRRWFLGLAIAYALYVFGTSRLVGGIQYYFSYYGEAGRGVGGGGGGGGGGWNYYQVTGTIAEARQVDLEQIARETNGRIILFILGFIGAFLALVRFPWLAVGGVLLGVGLFALQGGVRFTIYLVPIVSIGGAFIILLLQRYIHQYLPEKYLSKYLSWLVACGLLVVFAYPSVRLAYQYPPRSVAHPQQVAALTKLDAITGYDDYIISWWDYGYVMTYYSNMRNLINGGKHNEDNYIVSKAFGSTSQPLAANLIREAVEAYEAGGRGPKATALLFGTSRSPGFSPESYVNSMASSDYVRQYNKTRDIYLYVPYQMLRIYGVVRYFSDLNLATGRQQRAPLIVASFYRVDQENNRIVLPNSMSVDLKTGELRQRGQVVGRVNTVYDHRVQNNDARMISFPINGLGNYFVILSSYYRTAFVMGPGVFNSNFVQMFFFNRYDNNYFELVDRTPFATIYRLRV